MVINRTAADDSSSSSLSRDRQIVTDADREVVLDLVASAGKTWANGIVKDQECDDVTTAFAAFQGQVGLVGITLSVEPAHIEQGTLISGAADSPAACGGCFLSFSDIGTLFWFLRR
jgi:hypothetical protein